MPCDSNVPSAAELRVKPYDTFASVYTSTPTQYYPVDADVLLWEDCCEAQEQPCTLQQLHVAMNAATPSALVQDFVVLINTAAVLTTPTEGAVYNAATMSLVARIDVPQSAWKRISLTDYEAVIDVNRDYVSGTGALATNLYGVMLFSNATPTALTSPTYIAMRPTVLLHKL